MQLLSQEKLSLKVLLSSPMCQHVPEHQHSRKHMSAYESACQAVQTFWQILCMPKSLGTALHVLIMTYCATHTLRAIAQFCCPFQRKACKSLCAVLSLVICSLHQTGRQCDKIPFDGSSSYCLPTVRHCLGFDCIHGQGELH